MANLRILHDELLAALSEMEALTGRPSFDESELSRLRYRLSRVSGERRRLVEQLCLSLADHVGGAPAEHLRAVYAGSVEARSASNAHIGAWSIREVASDWEGYRRASAKMRAVMLAQIAAEKAALYPRLDPSAFSSAA
jgi:transposase